MKNNKFRRIVPNILYWLNQDEEFLEEEQILAWHKALSADSPLHESQHPNMKKLIEVLEAEDEEEDD